MTPLIGPPEPMGWSKEGNIKRKSLKTIGLVVVAWLTCACFCTWFDPREVIIDGDHPNPQVERLKSYVPEATRATIQPGYYTYFGFRDWWRFPLVYPYSIHAIDVLDHGRLCDERRVTDYRDINNQELIETGIDGITHLALDANLLLLRTRDRGSSTLAAFVLFQFGTGEQTAFSTEAELFEKAGALGFEGEQELITLRQYDALFWQ